MKTHTLLVAASVLLLAAFFFTHARGTAAAALVPLLQKSQEADKQAQKGTEYLNKKDWRHAVESFQKAVRADPRHVEANYGLGLAYLNLKQTTEALAAFSNVIATRPNPRVKDSLVDTGVIHFTLQHYKEAVEALEPALQLGDIGAVGHYFLGKAYSQLGRDAEALASLQRSATEPLYAQDSLVTIGFLRLKQNQPKEAIPALEQAVRLNAQYAPAQMFLGNAYLSAGRNEEALASLRVAASLDPNQFFTQYGLGYAHLALGHNEEAVAALTAALRLQPQSPDALTGLGNVYTRMNRYREAETAFSQALSLRADMPEALLGMCVFYYSQGQYPKLVSTAEQAARVAPKSAAAQTMLGAALATTGDMGGGMRAVREALRLEPDNYWPHHVLAFILVRDDKPQEALAEARVGVRLGPNYPETQNLLAYVLNQVGQHQEALTAAQAALRLKREPADEGWAFYNLATAQDKLGRREEALASFSASIKAYNQTGRTLDPDDLYLMGNAYLRLEQDEPAIKAFRQAILIRPNFPQARYNLGVAYFATGNRKGATDEYNALRRLDPARATKLQAIIGGKPGRR
ncbi:MAG: protein O-GlcNAc transferase [Acidobacteriota bacterium]|jgi:tetratricopeptide (TPR) repeat protein|nr:protein O-GlcNAc transferase [Acidobacteriota bacterium]